MNTSVCSATDRLLDAPQSGAARPNRPRVVLFCGDRSPYGLAHLRPVLDAFDVEAVVLATDERWATFHASLLGEPVSPPGALARCRRAVKALLPVELLELRARLLRRQLDARTILRASTVTSWDVSDVNDPAFLRCLAEREPDLIVTAAYPQIFGEELLAIPRLGAVNFHPSLLPAYRGAHPHFWVIARGEHTSGVTSHFMTRDLDAGDIIGQTEFSITGFTYSQLYDRIVAETTPLVHRTAQFFAAGRRAGTPQRAEGRTLFRNDRPIHRRIFWGLHTADQVENLSRTERAFCFFRGAKLVCLDARKNAADPHPTNGVEVECGTILDLSGGTVTVGTVDRPVEISAFQAGGRTCSASRWIRKYKPRLGEKLE